MTEENAGSNASEGDHPIHARRRDTGAHASALTRESPPTDRGGGHLNLRRSGSCLGALVAFAISAVGANGYFFGARDHAIHLPWLLRELDPAFLAGDPLVEAMGAHPSYFWKLQAVLLRLVPVPTEVLYAALWLVAVASILAGTAALARSLAPGKVGLWAAPVAAAAVLVARETLASIPTFDSLLLNRVAVLGTLLFALALGVARRYEIALLLVGLCFLIHATTSVHVAVMVGVAGLTDRQRWPALLAGIGLFLAAASPLWMSMLAAGSALPVPWPAPEVWIANTKLTVFFHHYASTFGMRWALLGMPLLILGAAWRMRPHRAVLVYGVVIAALCAAAFVGVEILHLPTALQLHLWESTRLLDFLAAASGAVWAVRAWCDQERNFWRRSLPALVMGCYVIDPLVLDAVRGLAPIASIADLAGQRMLALLPSALASLACVADWTAPPAAGSPRRVPGPLFAVSLATAVLLVSVGFRVPRLDWTFARSATRTGACSEHGAFAPSLDGIALDQICGLGVTAWAREHLPARAVVALPPYMHHPLTTFRWSARRSIVATWKDGAEGSFSVAYAAEWMHRILALSGRSDLTTRSVSDLRRAPDIVLAGYAEADGPRFRSLARRFGATHAIVESTARQPDLPLLYADEYFRLYAIASP